LVNRAFETTIQTSKQNLARMVKMSKDSRVRDGDQCPPTRGRVMRRQTYHDSLVVEKFQIGGVIDQAV
jgi:hypothetical protein